jgi:PAS domain S-box-containing protein
MATIQKIKERFQFLLESNIPAAVVDIDKKSVLLVTPAAALFFGKSKGDKQAREVLKNFLEQPDSKPGKWLKEIQKSGVSLRSINTGDHEVKVSATIPNTNEANILFLQFSATDAQPESKQWIHLINNLPEGIVIHREGKIVHLNRTAENLFSVVGEKMVGKPFLELFAGIEIKEIMKGRLKRWMNGETTDYIEFELDNNKKKETIYLGEETVFINMADGLSCQSVFTNLSIRKQWIHEKMRAQLAEEINQILKHEIKEHKITQEELEKARNLNLAVIESSRDMIITEDNNGKISLFNKAAEREFGYKREEVIGKGSKILFKDIKEYSRVRDMLKKQELFSLEVRNKRKNGEDFTAVLSASKLFSHEGKYLGSMGISRDVTKELEAAEKLKRSEELYRDLFDNMSDGYLLLDEKGNVKYFNAAALKIFKTTKTSIRNVNLLDCIHKEDIGRVKHLRKELIEQGKPINGLEYNVVTSKNQLRCVQVSSSPIFENGKFTGSRELIRDVSEQKQAREEAQEQMAKMHSFFESSAYFIWSVDEKYKLTSFNRNFAKMYERLSGKAPKLGMVAYGIGGKGSSEVKAFWKEKMEIGFSGKHQNFELKIPEAAGQYQWLDVVLNPVNKENGRIQELSGIAHSITFKKQAEGKIKEQAAKINSIFDSTAMLIWTLDKNLRISSYNLNFGKMLYKTFDIEIQIGQSFQEYVKPYVKTEHQIKLNNFFQNALKGNSVQFEGPLKKKNGQIFWMEAFLNPILTEDGKVGEISCMAHEITDKKIIEKQIRESLHEKEVLLQEVHHRVKNNLQVISSILNLQSSYVKDTNTLNILRESQNRIKSMSFIHESLYQTNDFSSIDFSDYILSLSKSLVHSYSINAGLVELKTNFEKVFLNLDQAIPCGLIVNELLSNALKYAFPNNRKGIIRMQIKEAKKKVELLIKDNGVGMPQDFDFDQNDSLGLQLVFTLIEQLDGEVLFKTKPNQGTEYLITFDKLN